MDISQTIQTIAIYALPVLFAITIHEAAHGYVARYLGDDTAYQMGRVTLNPIKHIDPIGTIAMPLLLLFTTFGLPGGPYVLGYAKPVPVQFGRLRRPRRDMIYVALAGPVSNFIQALAWGILLVVFAAAKVEEPFFLHMARAGIQVNVALAVFNLFPLPPLDGGRVLAGLVPARAALVLHRIEPFGFFIVLALIMSNILSAAWMQPLTRISYAALNMIFTPLLTALR